jgi:endonuclease III
LTEEKNKKTEIEETTELTKEEVIANLEENITFLSSTYSDYIELLEDILEFHRTLKEVATVTKGKTFDKQVDNIIKELERQAETLNAEIQKNEDELDALLYS